MSDLQKYSPALSLICVLIFIKFIFIPWSEWRINQIEDIKLLNGKIVRAGLLIDNKEAMNISAIAHQNKLSKIYELFYQNTTQAKFKLSFQKDLENLLEKYELKTSSIGWQNSYKIPNSNLIQHQISYNFDGSTYQAVEFFLELAKLNKLQKYEQLNFNLLRQRQGNLGRVRVAARMSLYQLEQE